MSRKSLYICVTCLLYLLPALSFSQSLTLYEYWFDDDFDNRISSSLSGANAVVNTSIDANQLDNGIHKFSFRAKQSDGKFSAVSSSLFLKRTAAQGSQVEYWFDDNFEQRDKIDILNTEDEQELSLDLRSSTKYPMGFHKLNMRVTLEGEGESAIYSSDVVKLSAGKATRLEYWIDDDYANVQTIEGKPSTDGSLYQFLTDLDLSGVSPGYHRLNCRSVSTSKRTSGAVTTMPIMVKSRYNVDLANVKMTHYSIGVDDEKPVTIKVKKDDELNLDPYTLDVRDLNTGVHTLKANFWNTTNIGVSLEQNFTVNAIESPTITLTAQEHEGIVTLKFNSIPNDVKWDIVRTDANGVIKKIGGKTESNYPSEITFVDNPSAGLNKYIARGYYVSVDRKRIEVKSNEVEVSVVSSHNEPLGKIYGSIRDANGNVLSGDNWKVSFSDNVTIESDLTGSYFRDKIPVGTVLEITAQYRNYSCKPVTVTVKEGTNRVFLEAALDEKLMRSRYTSDLEFDSNVEFEPRSHMKFKIKNITRLSWMGKLCIVTGRKDYMDNPPTNPFKQTNLTPEAQQLAGSVASFTVTDNIQYDYSDKITLSPGESKEVFISHHMPFTSPPSNKDELYYFFVKSIDEYGTKLVAVNDDYNIKENPLEQFVDNGQNDSEKQIEEEIESCTALIMGLCSTVTEFDGKLGEMSKCMEEMKQTLGYTLEYYQLADKIERCTNYSQILDDIPEWKFYHILYQENSRFLSLTNSVRDNIAKEVRACKNTLKYLKDVKTCIDMVKEYNQWQDMNELERVGAIADKVLELAEKEIPFANILKMYLDVTKKTIHNIDGLAEKWYSNHDYDIFYNGYSELYPNSNFIFDIRVKKDKWITTYFAPEDVKKRILSIEIHCVGQISSNDPLKCVATYTTEVEDGKLRLRRLNITGQSSSKGGIIPIVDMWMTIYWSNGRVSQVPIRNSDDMKGNGVKHDKNHYTITYQSGNDEVEHMADIIHLDD